MKPSFINLSILTTPQPSFNSYKQGQIKYFILRIQIHTTVQKQKLNFDVVGHYLECFRCVRIHIEPIRKYKRR